MRYFNPRVQATREGLLFAFGAQIASANLHAEQDDGKDRLLMETGERSSMSLVPKSRSVDRSLGIAALWEAAVADAAGESSRPLRLWETLIRRPASEFISDHLRRTFQERLDKWKVETAFTSSISEIVLNPNYQRIIGMGKDVVPLLLESLRKEPCLLFWALKAITDEDPVPESARGDIAAMSSLWIEWGIERGFIGGETADFSGLPEFGTSGL